MFLASLVEFTIGFFIDLFSGVVLEGLLGLFGLGE